MTIEEVAKILDRLTDVVSVIARRNEDVSDVLHELACIKESLRIIGEPRDSTKR